MIAPGKTGREFDWPPNVVEFASEQKVSPSLDPLLMATYRLFPTALAVNVYLETDPEIADLKRIVFEVRISHQDVADFAGAQRGWIEAMYEICPEPITCTFVLFLNTV